MTEVYHADTSLYGKLRRRFARIMVRKSAHMPPLSRPMATICFDDVPKSAAETARLLSERKIKATYFVAASLFGKTDELGTYADANDILAVADLGHEIACHTYSHLDCGISSKTRVDNDLEQNQQTFARLGLPAPRTFAYPYGDVGIPAKRVINQRFLSGRALHHGLVTDGSDLNQIPAIGIEGDKALQTIQYWVDQALKTPQSWLVLYTHDVQPSPTAFGCTPETFKAVLDLLEQGGFETVTYEEGAKRLSQPR